MKDSGFRIRIERNLREKFVAACKADDKPAAQIVREFMRTYVEEFEQNNSNSPALARPIDDTFVGSVKKNQLEANKR